MIRLLLVFACLISFTTVMAQDTPLTLENEPGNVLSAEFIATHPLDEINAIIENFYPPEQQVEPQYAVDEYRVWLESQQEDGEAILILAQVFIPRVETETAFPVFILGAGSSGLSDHCAPSMEQPEVQNWGSYKAYMLSVATNGYIAAVPDYAGFSDGDPQTFQPYYVAEMAGRVLLDSGRAMYGLFEPDAGFVTDTAALPAQTVFMAGYSQGGQSIFAAKDISATYAPDVPLAGVIGYAPVINMQSHMLNLPLMAPYRMYAWSKYYGEDAVDLSAVFTDHWLPTLEADVLSKCVLDAAGYFSRNPTEMYRPEFLSALQNGTLEENYPRLHELFERNNPGFVQNDVQALIVQGTEDWIFPMETHDQFIARYCAAGNHVTDLVYEGGDHFRARQVSYLEVLAWMQQVATGEPVPDICAES